MQGDQLLMHLPEPLHSLAIPNFHHSKKLHKSLLLQSLCIILQNYHFDAQLQFWNSTRKVLPCEWRVEATVSPKWKQSPERRWLRGRHARREWGAAPPTKASHFVLPINKLRLKFYKRRRNWEQLKEALKPQRREWRGRSRVRWRSKRRRGGSSTPILRQSLPRSSFFFPLALFSPSRLD